MSKKYPLEMLNGSWIPTNKHPCLLTTKTEIRCFLSNGDVRQSDFQRVVTVDDEHTSNSNMAQSFSFTSF